MKNAISQIVGVLSYSTKEVSQLEIVHKLSSSQTCMYQVLISVLVSHITLSFPSSLSAMTVRISFLKFRSSYMNISNQLIDSIVPLFIQMMNQYIQIKFQYLSFDIRYFRCRYSLRNSLDIKKEVRVPLSSHDTCTNPTSVSLRLLHRRVNSARYRLLRNID